MCLPGQGLARASTPGGRRGEVDDMAVRVPFYGQILSESQEEALDRVCIRDGARNAYLYHRVQKSSVSSLERGICYNMFYE